MCQPTPPDPPFPPPSAPDASSDRSGPIALMQTLVDDPTSTVSYSQGTDADAAGDGGGGMPLTVVLTTDAPSPPGETMAAWVSGADFLLGSGPDASGVSGQSQT